MTAEKQPQQGDKVTWQAHGSTAHGQVEQKITSDTHAAGRTVRADDNDPQYLVRSDKSGRVAVHHPEALRRRKHFNTADNS